MHFLSSTEEKYIFIRWKPEQAGISWHDNKSDSNVVYIKVVFNLNPSRAQPHSVRKEMLSFTAQLHIISLSFRLKIKANFALQLK